MSMFDVTSPFDGSVIQSLPTTTREAAQAALEQAHQLYRNRAGWLSATKRIEVLKQLAELVRRDVDSLAKQAAAEGGKPLQDSKVEVERAVNGIEVAAAEIASLHGTEIPMGLNEASEGRTAHTYREPRGVVLAISAFNHPFNLIVHQVVTAVAAGCPVLVKPARTTPLSCIRLVELLYRAGLPMEWCTVILSDREVTEELVGDRRVSFLTFIGSARVGWYLRSKLAPGATCALEHGGVAPVIVDETADLDACIAPLTRGGFYHAGQVCVSVQRIYLHRSIADAFTQKYLASVAKLQTGDPLDAATEVGPLISTDDVDRVHEWVQEAVEGGGQLLCGGNKISETVYEPTVIFNPPAEAKVTTEEIFGPVVCLYSYDRLDDAIERANAPDSFFQAAIYTNRLDTAMHASRALNGMAVMVNDHTAFRVDWMPFGGHGMSGLGAGGIGHSMRDMTIERMVVINHGG